MTSTTVTTTATTYPSPLPTLGLALDPRLQQGYGETEPRIIDSGGDPTGIVTGIVWRSWGAPQATGVGTSEYVAPGQLVVEGHDATATVVAFNLGSCGGHSSYQAVEWYFPEYGESFSPHDYINPCTGQHVGDF